MMMRPKKKVVNRGWSVTLMFQSLKWSHSLLDFFGSISIWCWSLACRSTLASASDRLALLLLVAKLPSDPKEDPLFSMSIPRPRACSGHPD